MKTYKPSGAFSVPGLFILLGISLAAALALGGIAHLVGRFFYLIILFPLVMGFGASMAVSFGVTTGKCRNSAIALVVALITGAVTYGSMHYFDYLHFRSSNVNYIMESNSMTEEAASATFDLALKEETGATGFIGYMKNSAMQGVSIGKAGRSGLNIGEIGTWIYYVLELAGILFLASLGASAAKDPFCEKCEEWYDENTLAHSAYGTDNGLIEVLKAEKFAELPSKLELTHDTPSVRIKGSICAKCNAADAVVTLEAVSLNEKGNEETSALHSQMIPMTDFTAFIAGIEKLKQAPKKEETAQDEPAEEAVAAETADA